MQPILQELTDYLAAGLWIFPCHSVNGLGRCSCDNPACEHPGKHPRTSNGSKDASNSERMIQGWFHKWPDANWAVAAGPSGLVILDIDGPDGRKSLAEAGIELPDGPAVISGRIDGGEHRYFVAPSYPVKNSVKFLPGLDTRAANGYVIIPPSRHKSGSHYRWLTPFDRETLPELPQKLRPLLESRSRGSQEPIEIIPEGMRDVTLISEAGTIRRRGGSREATLAYLRQRNKDACRPPLSDEQVEKIADQAGGFPAGNLLTLQPHTEAGYAQRMALYHGDEIRYVEEESRWYEWDGRRWVRGSSKGVDAGMQARAKAMLEATYLAANTITDFAGFKALPDAQNAFRANVRAKESKRAIDAIIDLTRSEPGIRISPATLDSDPWIINLQNGTIDGKNGTFTAGHDPSKFITKLAAVAYDPAEQAPIWERFVSEVFDGDGEVIAYVRRCLGYLLVGDTTEQDIWIAYGNGANGKSTLLNTVIAVMGGDVKPESYGTSTAFTTFDADNRNQYGNDLAALMGRRFVFASESESERNLAEARVKLITGGDAISCKFLYGEFFTFVPQFRVWLAVNHKPNIRKQDRGIWRRVKLIPFTRNFEATDDKRLSEKLREELPGILDWLLAGLADWREGGMRVPASIARATEDYREESDVIGQWLEERAELGPDYSTGLKDLYNDYMQWHIDNHGPTVTP